MYELHARTQYWGKNYALSEAIINSRQNRLHASMQFVAVPPFFCMVFYMLPFTFRVCTCAH